MTDPAAARAAASETTRRGRPCSPSPRVPPTRSSPPAPPAPPSPSAALGLGRWPGVRRPPLAAVLPTVAGRLVLLDVGSLASTPAEHTLATHARARRRVRRRRARASPRPRVGLLTIGTERGKGDRAAPRRRPACSPPRRCPPAPATSAWSRATTWSLGARGRRRGDRRLHRQRPAQGPRERRTPWPAARRAGDVPPRAAILLGVAGTVVVCHGAATGRRRRRRHRPRRPPAPPRRGPVVADLIAMPRRMHRVRVHDTPR